MARYAIYLAVNFSGSNRWLTAVASQQAWESSWLASAELAATNSREVLSFFSYNPDEGGAPYPNL